MNADELRLTSRAAVDVRDVIPDLLPLSERSLRRALEPGGELEHLALRVGRRVLLRVDPLRELLGMTPDMSEAGPDSPATATTNDRNGPGHGSSSHLSAV